MSLYPFSAWHLTTEEDRRRRPVVSADQLARILIFFAVAVVAVAFIAGNARAQGMCHEIDLLADHEPATASSALPPGSPDAIVGMR